MKGVVLAGGSGTRLRPTTKVINKHVLPLYENPMIYYPVQTLLDAGVRDIMVISSPDYIGKYIQLLESEFDANFTYKVQSDPDGIADAVSLAEDFVDDKVAVILGDNIIFGDVASEVADFHSQESGARIFLHEVDDPSAYGVATIDDGKVTSLIEKPDNPSSDKAVIGFYLYNKDVFEKIADIEPSDRGELEITAVNKEYVAEDELTYGYISDAWFDAGTPEGLYQAATYVREHGVNREDETSSTTSD
jgi:glucose-1-phosphate thymidylyltransferase